MSGKLSNKDIAFLWGIVKHGGEANVGEIREETKENSAVPELDNSAVNYRCRRLGQEGTSTVSGKGFVEVRPGGVQENGQPAPKVVKLVDESIESEVRAQVENRSVSVDSFDNIEEAFRHFLEQVDEVEAKVSEQDETIEKLTEEFKGSLGAIRQVLLDEHGVDIADGVDEDR